MLNEILTNAHMAGQSHAGCKHPSWGDALGYSHSVLPGTLERAARQYIEESPENSPASPVQHAKHAEALREIAADIESAVDRANERNEHTSAVDMMKWARQLRALQFWRYLKC